MSEVVAELLCTAAVATTPREKLAASLRKSTRSNRPSIRSSTVPCMIFIMPRRATKSSASATRTNGIVLGTQPVTRSENGRVSALSGLARPMPPAPAKRPCKKTAALSTGWNRISSGRMVNAASRLKKSCTVDAANARSNSAGRVTGPIATIVLVVVVPIFVPMMMGTAS